MTNTKWTLGLITCLALAGCQQQEQPRRVVDCRGNDEKPIAHCIVTKSGEFINCGCKTEAEAAEAEKEMRRLTK